MSAPRPSYIRLDIEQGTPEWLELRRHKVTASKMPALFGICPYTKQVEVLQEMKTGKERFVDSYQRLLFAQGHRAEVTIRQHLEQKLGYQLQPAVLLYTKLPDLLVSL